MQRVLALVKKNIKAGTRDNLLAYVLVTPILLAVFLKLWLPTLQANSIDIVMLRDKSELAQEVSRFADVAIVETQAAIEKTVMGLDDKVGFVSSPEGTVVIVFEGNEDDSVREVAGIIANKVSGVYKTHPATVRELGTATASPFLPYTVIFSALTALLIGGMFIGFGIIEEKENRIIDALAATPLGRIEFVLGYSITGVIVSVLLTLSVFSILKVDGVNYWHAFLLTLAGLIPVVIFGFFSERYQQIR